MNCCYQSFIYSPTDALVSCFKKKNIEIYTKAAPLERERQRERSVKIEDCGMKL